jgi:hypothetical protein
LRPFRDASQKHAGARTLLRSVAKRLLIPRISMSAASALLAALLLSAGSETQAQLQTLSGKKLAGDLVGLDRQTVILRTADGDVRHPVADLLQVDLPPAADVPPKGGYTDVELTDGTVLHCGRVLLKAKKAELVVLPDLAVSVPLTQVFTVLRDAHDPKVRQDWQQFLARRGRFDMVVVRADDKLNGLDGTFGDGTEAGDGIAFTLAADERKVTPKLARVQGLIFNQRPDPNAPPALCKVADAAGNVLVAADAVLNDGGLVVTTVSGVRVTYPDAKRLAKLDFSKGKLTYLSDLEPTRQAVSLATEDDDLYARFVRFRKDANLENGPLRLSGQSHPKGLALHAGTVLAYDIGGDYKEFRALLGVDEYVETESRVEVVVEGDGRELFRGQVSRKDPPKPLAVDVRNVRELRVSVKAIGLLDLGAQVDLVDAKVSK